MLARVLAMADIIRAIMDVVTASTGVGRASTL